MTKIFRDKNFVSGSRSRTGPVREAPGFFSVAVLLLSIFPAVAGPTFAEPVIVKDPGSDAWTVSENDIPILRYNYGIVKEPKGFSDRLTSGKRYAVARGNYIHPLYDLRGKPITADWNEDHPHHRGIYWAWPEVGYDGASGDLHALQLVLAKPNGNIRTFGEENGRVGLIAENLWIWDEKEPIVLEEVMLTVHPLDRSGRTIDMRLEIRCLVDEVSLARRKRLTYGGMNIRLKSLDRLGIGSYYEPGNKHGWVFASWHDAESNAGKQLTVFEGVDNPHYPGDMVRYPHLDFFGTAFPGENRLYVMKKGDILVLRYRFRLHDSSNDDRGNDEAWESFRQNGTGLKR